MPSKSAKQMRTMAAAAHSPKFAKKMGIDMSVAKEFNAADSKKRPAAMPMKNPKSMGKGMMPFRPTKFKV